MTADHDRCEVRALLARSLGLARIPEPIMRVSVVDEKALGGCHLQCLAGTSWPGATVTAHHPPASPALSNRGPSEQILAQWECFLANI